MNNYKILFIVIFIGIVTAASLVYFYTIQRNFTQNHREFLVALNRLESSQNHLKSSILLNSLYAYNNEDDVAKAINETQESLKLLLETNILTYKNYLPIKKEILHIKEEIDKNIIDIEHYTMLNAGIQNSLLFLSRHVEKATKLQKADKYLYIKANKILKTFTNAKNTQDLDYLKHKKQLIQTDSKSNATQKFVGEFNLHSAFIMKKFGPYITSTKKILNNKIEAHIESIRDNFSKISLSDFYLLDKFAFILFLGFIFSTILIILLIIKYIKEHLKLLETTKSLEHSFNYDLLTDLYNRNAFEKHLQTLKRPHIIIINIDDFKQINDVYGNEFGNKALKIISAYIKSYIKLSYEANVYRLGGDEFGILFDNINAAHALEISYDLEEKISKHAFMIEPLKLNISVSVASNNIAPILENADLALKEIKKDKTKKVIEYKESYNLKKNIEENLEVISIIKKALKEDRVIPYFQPIVNLETLKIEKYEALVRIIQRDGTILLPYKFLDISKKTPYYQEITRVMINKTIEIAKLYPYRFSINISMADILNKDIVDTMFHCFKEDIHVSSRIDIELLESENLEKTEQVQNFINRAHSFGSKILIDDFGTGYSNFTYFSNLDVDMIKIDGSIVREITTNERKLHMLKTIHEFSKGMDMQNVAEFVETKEMAILLKEIGITYAQGYYFGKPEEKPLESDTVTL